jgi:hypothetical protein
MAVVHITVAVVLMSSTAAFAQITTPERTTGAIAGGVLGWKLSGG